ncbi:hypothetical protein D3C72_2227790 [compost metagenome]
MRHDRRQFFRPTGLLAINQSNPHARPADDHVVHADEPAFEHELGSGLVEDHCGLVAGNSGAAITEGDDR